MAENVRRFEVVPDDDTPSKSDPAAGMLLLALQALSKRAILGLESCFSLITVGLVFWAAYPILTASPTVNQLIGLGSFSVFTLIANYLVLRRRA